ncbi:ATP-binding protein [soil metagenome]
MAAAMDAHSLPLHQRLQARARRWFRRLRKQLRPAGARRAIKRRIPRSLFGRSLLIIVLPIVVMQAAVGWVFFDAQWRTVTRQLSEALAGDVAWDVEAYEADPTPANFARIAERAERVQSLSVAFQPGRAVPKGRRPSLIPTFDDALREAVDDKITQGFWVDATRYPAYVDIRVQVRTGVLRFLAPRERAFSTKGPLFIFWLTLVTVLLTGVAVAFIRNQVRAIERLAQAADAFGRGVDVEFKPYGAAEVRLAAQAFIDMKNRIQRHIEQRTTLLAAVSHDLRTPLTRLKLEAALADPGPRVDAIKRDLDDMSHMIDDYLAFARGEDGEAAEAVMIAPLVEAVAQDARGSGASVSAEVEPGLVGRLRPNSVRRALSNLAMNAAAHAKTVRIMARALEGGGLSLTVDDDGPGIPPALYEEAFRPFSRLDASRNQNRQGVGLGLAIARDVARGHGGDVILSRSDLGGLRAELRLPG